MGKQKIKSYNIWIESPTLKEDSEILAIFPAYDAEHFEKNFVDYMNSRNDIWWEFADLILDNNYVLQEVIAIVVLNEESNDKVSDTNTIDNRFNFPASNIETE